MDAGFLLLPEFTHAPATRARTSPARRFAKSTDRPTVNVRRLAPRDVLFAPGDAACEAHEVLQGAVMVSRTMSDGRRQILDIVGPGRLFGFAASARHDCTAIALTSSTVCALERTAADRSPEVAERVTRDAFAEIERLRGLALVLGRMSALERVAHFLCAMVGDEDATSAEIVLPVNRTEIADHLGLTIETVSRTITKLKRLGLLRDVRGETLSLPDCADLRRIAHLSPAQGRRVTLD